MIDQARAAREDLAFMKELAEDRGPMHSVLGAHMFAVGAPYGLNVIYAWAGLRGFAPWPTEWQIWAWLPGTIAYLPILALIIFKGRNAPQGPTSRAFSAAWAGAGVMTWVIISVLVVATPHTGPTVWGVWPALAVCLYGGAWTSISLIRRRYWGLAVAAGCFATAIACAARINTPEHWLAMGLGLLLFMAVPGALIMRKSRTA